jgi:hypothetical protein
MLPVDWTHGESRHCLSDAGARNLLINIERLNAHIEILEGCIRAGEGEDPRRGGDAGSR